MNAIGRVRKSCSWCDEMVTLDPTGGPVFCASCGHRGDVARIHCTCARCGGPATYLVAPRNPDGTLRYIRAWWLDGVEP